VDVWTLLILTATLSIVGIVGIVGLLYECWQSVRASEMPYGNAPPIQCCCNLFIAQGWVKSSVHNPPDENRTTSTQIVASPCTTHEATMLHNP
jgi:hypothetical protein